ncbi:MAG: lipoprotein [Gammaproteobacteria bacterium]
MPGRLIIYMALLTCSLTLAACGQKGPLYMPEESSTATQPAAPQQQADTD